MANYELISMRELLDQVRNGLDRGSPYYVYSEKIALENYSLDMPCYLGDGPQVTDNDEEVFPDFVTANSLEVVCSDELLKDVVDNALRQNSQVAVSTLLRAVIHYIQRDDFLDLD